MISLSLYLYLSESERASVSTASTDPVLDFLELVLIESKYSAAIPLRKAQPLPST
jgi:hypothetical protein